MCTPETNLPPLAQAASARPPCPAGCRITALDARAPPWESGRARLWPGLAPPLSVYRWLAGADARASRARADVEFAERIAQIHQESDGAYRAPRVTAELKDSGLRVNHKRVERVLRTFHIVGLHLRKKVRTTIPEPWATPVPDLLQRDFTAQVPNTKYVGDITYLPVGTSHFL